MDASQFVVDDQVKIQFAGLYILFAMEKEAAQFYELLRGDERVLQPIFGWLRMQEYVEAERGMYSVTLKGQAVLESFLQRYVAFLGETDIFCGVDLKDGEFAFRYYEQYEDVEQWQQFLAEDRWTDLRIAIAEYKGLDPIEIVFMNLIHEGRFGRNEEGGWCTDRLLGGVWDEIQSICNTSLRLKSLRQQSTEKSANPDQVISDILRQGQSLVEELGGT